jgi:shikimate kinase
VIYLHAGAAILARRLEASPQADQRPSLTGKPIAEEIAEILAAREVLYREVAHHVLDASAAPQTVVSIIVQHLYPCAAE